MAAIGTLSAKVTADTSQFEAGMKRAGKAQTTFKQDVEKLGQSLTLLRGGAAVAGIYAITGALVRFNNQLDEIQKARIAGASIDEVTVKMLRAIPIAGELGYQLSQLADNITGTAFERNLMDSLSESAKNARKEINETLKTTQAAIAQLNEKGVPKGNDPASVAAEQVNQIGDIASKGRGTLDKEAKDIDQLRKQARDLNDLLNAITGESEKTISLRRQSLEKLNAEIQQRDDALTANRIRLNEAEQQAISRTNTEAYRERMQELTNQEAYRLNQQYQLEDELERQATESRMQNIRAEHEYEAMLLNRKYEREAEEEKQKRMDAATSGPVARFAQAIEANSADAARFMQSTGSNTPESQTAKNTKRTADLINDLKAAYLMTQGVSVRI